MNMGDITHMFIHFHLPLSYDVTRHNLKKIVTKVGQKVDTVGVTDMYISRIA